LDVGIPARGLHGEAYRGHVFWDEIFVFPFLNLRMPELARALVLYRWRRLPQARVAAREAGFRGAMFPWQSGSDGREEAPAVHLNPRSGHWITDNSHLQRHINVAVAYNTWRYYEASGDRDFLSQFGAELILDIAQFWASAANYDRVGDRYDIRNVMGPDEYHDGYPWRDRPGLDNNTYTNLMVVWTLRRALACIALLPDRRRSELLSLLGIRREDVERWEHMTRKMRLCWVAANVLAQFEGFERLRPFPWTEYVERYGDITRLDRILEAEGDSPNNYQLAKQADVLMLFYLLSADELADLLHRLGYQYTPRLIPSTVDFYRRCTSHGSTLSKVVHAWVMARSDRPAAWQFFLDALEADVAGHLGGTTGEGIHLGAMAGTLDLLQRAFTGLETRGEVLHLEPSLPDELASMSFRLHYRHHHGLEVYVDHDRVIISGRAHPAPPLTVRVRGEDHRLDPSGAVEVPLTSR
ncbi:MAG: glycosyl hydrolase family 65 protein, partial [Pseudonocardiaceae bacterium]